MNTKAADSTGSLVSEIKAYSILVRSEVQEQAEEFPYCDGTSANTVHGRSFSRSGSCIISHIHTLWYLIKNMVYIFYNDTLAPKRRPIRDGYICQSIVALSGRRFGLITQK